MGLTGGGQLVQNGMKITKLGGGDKPIFWVVDGGPFPVPPLGENLCRETKS